MIEPKPKSIYETLKTLDETENEEAAFLIAAAINLYSEGIKRRAGRVLYQPNDVKKLFEMCRMVLEIEDLPFKSVPKARPAKLTEEEEDKVLDVEKAIGEKVQELRRDIGSRRI